MIMILRGHLSRQHKLRESEQRERSQAQNARMHVVEQVAAEGLVARLIGDQVESRVAAWLGDQRCGKRGVNCHRMTFPCPGGAM